VAISSSDFLTFFACIIPTFCRPKNAKSPHRHRHRTGRVGAYGVPMLHILIVVGTLYGQPHFSAETCIAARDALRASGRQAVCVRPKLQTNFKASGKAGFTVLF